MDTPGNDFRQMEFYQDVVKNFITSCCQRVAKLLGKKGTITSRIHDIHIEALPSGVRLFDRKKNTYVFVGYADGSEVKSGDIRCTHLSPIPKKGTPEEAITSIGFSPENGRLYRFLGDTPTEELPQNDADLLSGSMVEIEQALDRLEEKSTTRWGKVLRGFGVQ